MPTNILMPAPSPTISSFVMPGLVPGNLSGAEPKKMAGTSPAITIVVEV